MDNILNSILQRTPPVTKYFFTTVLILTIISTSGLVSPLLLAYDYFKIFKDHEYWRLITCFFYGSWSFGFIINFFVLLRYMKNIEESFASEPSYVFSWYLFSVCLIILVFTNIVESLSGDGFLFLQNNFYLSDLLETLFYLSVRRTNGHLNVMGFFNVSTTYIPLMLPLADMLIYGTGIKHCVNRIILNNLIYFLWDVYPKLHGFCILSPPWVKYRN